jgi:hypothetical protein
MPNIIDYDLEEDFWSKVEIKTPGECWPWKSHRNSKNYGYYHTKSKVYPAGRFVYELINGGIVKGLCVYHTCSNNSCVNPNHLYVASKKGRSQGKKPRNPLLVRPDEERFLSYVKPDPNGCLLWSGYLQNGYGVFKPANNNKMVAHKWFYEYKLGPVPPGFQLDHLCRVRHCVNLNHLEPVTPKENNRRSQSASAKNAKKTHCLRGHLFNEANTYIRPNSARMCRVCARLSKRKVK